MTVSEPIYEFDVEQEVVVPMRDGVRLRAAVNTVFHDALRPSHVVLPVMP